MGSTVVDPLITTFLPSAKENDTAAVTSIKAAAILLKNFSFVDEPPVRIEKVSEGNIRRARELFIKNIFA
jgi:hypothetical protein